MPCKNNGVCVADNDADTRKCTCPAGYEGLDCETQQSMSYRKLTFYSSHIREILKVYIVQWCAGIRPLLLLVPKKTHSERPLLPSNVEEVLFRYINVSVFVTLLDNDVIKHWQSEMMHSCIILYSRLVFFHYIDKHRTALEQTFYGCSIRNVKTVDFQPRSKSC